MQLYFIVLVFLVGAVLARYHEKTRFDRSVRDERETKNTENIETEKQWSFADDVTQFIAYKSKQENECYLENIKQRQPRKKWQPKVLYPSTTLTKLEAWRLAGGRIVSFCNGRSIVLLHAEKPVPGRATDPFLNEIPVDENDISPKRIIDVILTPLRARTKRQIQHEQREKLNENYNRNRQRRQTGQFRGKFRGQTQSQYLNLGNGEQKEGKAEAEATEQSSRAIVSGNRGMGQAQSMSSGGIGCEDCPGYPAYPGIEGVPDKIRVPLAGADRYPQVPSSGIATQPGAGVVPGVGVSYPGGVLPAIGPGTYPGGFQPEIVTPGSGTYPGGLRPGIAIPGRDGTYPGGVQPGIAIPTPGRDGTYPGGVQSGIVTPGSDGTYPGSVRPGVAIRGDGGTYIGGIQPGIVKPGIDGTYLDGIQPGVIRPGGVRPSGISPGGVTTGVVTGVGTYPGGIRPGIQPGQGTYPPNGIVTSSVTTGTATVTDVGAYPISIAPESGVLPSGTYPGVSGTGTYPGTGVYPVGVRPGIVTGTGVGTYPGSIVPGGTEGQVIYPGQPISVSYPGGVPSAITPSGGQAPDTVATTGAVTDTGTQVITYPRGPTNGQAIYPGPGVIQPGGIPEGTGGAPGIQITYPGGAYPGGQVTYPGGNGHVTTYPGQYPGTGTGISGGIQYPMGGQPIIGGTNGIGQYPGQYPGGIGGQGVDTGRYPTRPYPGASGITGMGDVSQYTRPGGPVGVADDGVESQASSSVQQVDSGTQASASAQGKYGSGTAQSQVTGTYSGSGSFSAQAGTSDINKSVQTEISGGKEGATSNAHGIAGYGKSQTQVQLDSDSGATSTGAQSGGWNHGTNSQVQASSKGGMADAQANGEGSTSSQAQIGFQPYVKNEDEKVEKHATPFRGSGTASAQSGTHRGQSQSQLQGSFQYGITYTGAAQAGSGSGAASSRKPFNFSTTDPEFFKPFKSHSTSRQSTNIDDGQSNSPVSPNYTENTENDREQGLQSSSTSRQTVVVTSKNNRDNGADKKVLATEKPRTDEATYDEYDDDYGDEDDYPAAVTGPRSTLQETASKTFSDLGTDHRKFGKTTQQQGHSQSQTIQIAKGNRYDIRANQDSNTPRIGDIVQPGQSVSGYTIPPGFRGRVTSISGAETIAQGNGKSQSQTVSLIPKDTNNKSPLVTETRSLRINHGSRTANGKSQGSAINQNVSSDKRAIPASAVNAKPTYYTVTNSFAGKMNGNNEPRKYEHRYYTKSSTCGYFTFSCNVVYGSNGRTKICKPKVSTYANGIPMRC